ncbi:cyclic-di-AMP receptor [Alkalihalobacillus sp. MEB203]|uniref:Cyclic-di-AMP receptor n=2 Tax=Alkalihalobacterium chitinilyticum TaxID=2980103 RepID=A0ABT5VJI2_9BACI|nr:cyclic-di-AMP receptor [Alkalihalobacterium chitinilyticum]
MKLMICIMENYYANEVEKQLKYKGFRMTELASTGGFLRKGSTTFLFGVEEKDIEELRKSLQDACLHVEKQKGRKRSVANRYTSFIIPASPALVPLLQT